MLGWSASCSLVLGGIIIIIHLSVRIAHFVLFELDLRRLILVVFGGVCHRTQLTFLVCLLSLIAAALSGRGRYFLLLSLFFSLNYSTLLNLANTPGDGCCRLVSSQPSFSHLTCSKVRTLNNLVCSDLPAVHPPPASFFFSASLRSLSSSDTIPPPLIYRLEGNRAGHWGGNRHLLKESSSVWLSQ